jgi:predicted Rossmann fold flavoprotein
LINWIPEYHEQSARDLFIQLRASGPAQKVASKNPFGLPSRLWEFLVFSSSIMEASRWGEISNQQLNLLVKNLVMYACDVRGKTTYKEEFVTAGGIEVSEVDPNTMMSRKIPNLYFAGEVLNVDGITGGFNFQHAWTSAFIAASSISHRSV